MREIHLNHGKVAIVDDEDYLELSKYSWMYHNKGYAYRRYKSEFQVKVILMHREVMGINEIGRKVHVDHINHDRLDNTKRNLRLCTSRENTLNSDYKNNGFSMYKGVTRKSNGNKWYAQINKAPYQRLYLGGFDTEEEAALAYNEAAKKYHGEFAYLNKIPISEV